MSGLRPATFLDRDGVINDVRLVGGVPHPPVNAEQMRLLPGVESACQRLRDLGFVIVVVTNQPDVARGGQTLGEVERIHASLLRRLPIDEIMMCLHDDADECHCRKPRPGMILDAAAKLGLDLSRSYCVGDRWRDVAAGNSAGVRTIHVQRGYAERRATGAHAVVMNLPGAVSFIESELSQTGMKQ